MNTKRISVVTVMALALVAVALTPSSASAQTRFEGTVTLPCTTYWGSAVLPAGEYAFSVASNNQNASHLQLRGAKNMDLFVITNRDANIKGNALELKRTGPSAVVTNVSLGAAGISMRFKSSASAKELLVAAVTPPTTELVKITVTE